MGDSTKIEWTDATWNPVTGCTKVSQGCKHCYAERDWARMVHLPAYQGRAFTDVECHPERLYQPIRWKKPRRIFVNSMSDLFYQGVPDEFIAQVFAVMAATPEHTYHVLTKRPERMLALLDDSGFSDLVDDLMHIHTHSDADWPLPNVWLGVSVEDQATADERIPLLLRTPAVVRWISAEPLLGPVHVGLYLSRSNMPGLRMMPGFRDSLPGIDWVVAGGESGPKARPSHPDWFRSLRDQCKAAGVPFLFKQWGGMVAAGRYAAERKNRRETYRQSAYLLRDSRRFLPGRRYVPLWKEGRRPPARRSAARRVSGSVKIPEPTVAHPGP